MMEAFDIHMPKGYIYFAMFFSVCVERQNRRIRNNMEILVRGNTDCNETRFVCIENQQNNEHLDWRQYKSTYRV